MDTLISSDIFIWVILPLLIFLARIADVSLATIRIIFVSKGLKYSAPIVGFFEVIIWLMAIRVIMQNLNNWACYFAYGAGFAMGTFIGLRIEKRLAIGSAILRIITQKDATELINHLRSQGYGVTVADAQGSTGVVHVIFTIIKRHYLENVVEIIHRFNPKAFYTVEDIRGVSEGIFPMKKSRLTQIPVLGSFMFWRKGK